MRGRKHSDESRTAVMAALLAGQSVGEVATQYCLDKSVVSRIRSSIPPDKLQQVATNKEAKIDELLCGYLVENLITLRAQAAFARNETWLEKQPASEIATLHGVMADKAIRLLEAAAAAKFIPESGDSPGAPTPGESGGRSDEAGAASAAANVPTGIAEAAH